MNHLRFRIITSWILSFVLLEMFLFSSLQAADGRVAEVRFTGEKIRIDGVLDEKVWLDGPGIGEFVQVEPNNGEKPTEATEVRIAYDKHALYIAARCYDRRPERILSTEMGRDADLGENDHLGFLLDTYHDHRNAYLFATNPAGALLDGRITENKEEAIDWNGIWNVRTLVDDQGWTAEFEIPFKTIGFSPSVREWGFNIQRRQARLREISRWASPSLDIKLYHVNQAGHLTGLEGLTQGVGLDVKPYGIAGFTRDIESPDRLRAAHSGGVDIFYRITSNLVSSTTFHTDFAETEADTRQVNLTRFSTFFPEKRSFFLEDAGIFDFAGGRGDEPGDGLLFFSRRIGLVGGKEVPILAGEKLTGKIGRFDIGLLDVQTDDLVEEDLRLVPGKNLAVGRVKANFGRQSYVGALFTNGDPTGRTGNQAGGLDLKLATSSFLKSEKNLGLTLFGAKTRTSGVVGRDTAYGGSILFPNDLTHFEYKWLKIGENFEPAMGFMPRRGVRLSSLNTELRPRPKFWNIRQMSFEFEYADYYNLEHRSSETREVSFTPFQWRFHSGEFISYDWTRNVERLYEEWEIFDGVSLPAGEYTFATHGIGFESSQNKPLSIGMDLKTGSFFSGTRREVEVDLTWRKDRHLSTSLAWEQNWVRLDEGKFNTSLVMYRLDYAFTPLISLANFVQYDTESRNIGLQSRLRWILQPGNEFFVVLNHAWQENRYDRFESAQTRFRVKLNYTFRF